MNDNRREFAGLISEIESNSSSSIANIIRKLRQLENSNNNENNNQILSSFMEHLNEEITKRNSDINKFCNTFYQKFIDSITELMQVQEDTNELKQYSSELKRSHTVTVRKVNQDSSDLVKCFAFANNIDKAIENLELCLPIFDQYLKAEKCINEGRYYPALKALNYLEINQLQRVNQFAFSDTLQLQIPGMREQIKSASKDEIKDFLETVRKFSGKVGYYAMKQIADKNGIEVGSEPVMTGIGGIMGTAGASTQGNMDFPININNYKIPVIKELDTVEKEVEELLNYGMRELDADLPNGDNVRAENIEDLVDFGPVYRSLHIHTVLGERHEFEKCYRNQRQRQCTLLLTLNKQDEFRNYCQFFSGIIGFFVVEDYIRYSEMSLVTRNYLDELWSHTLNRVSDFINENSKYIQVVETLLELKNYCVLFGKTMRSLGFNVAGFKDFYNILRYHYQNLLTKEYEIKFGNVFKGEDYTAITVESPADMELVVELYPNFLTNDIDSLPYPKSLTFSWMVPRIFQLTTEHIQKSKNFSVHLEMSQTEMEDQLNHTTNQMFQKVLLNLFKLSIHNSINKINQLIQLVVNMDELDAACNGLQNYIWSMVGLTSISSTSAATTGGGPRKSLNNASTTQIIVDEPPRPRLHAFSLLKELKLKVEDKIYMAINAKIDDMFDDNEYTELNSQPTSNAPSVPNSPSKSNTDIASTSTTSAGTSTTTNTNSLPVPQPSTFILDVIKYLNITFETFTNFPARIAQTICMLSCKYIAEKLHNVLKVQPKLSKKFIQQFAVDIECLREFTTTIPVSGMSLDTLAMVFDQLRQMSALVLNNDWEYFIKNYRSADSKYDTVSSQLAIILFEKTRQNVTTFGAFLKNLKKNKQDKKEDEILHQLKELR